MMENTIIYAGCGNFPLTKKILQVFNSIGGTNYGVTHRSKAIYADGECDDQYPDGENIRGKDVIIFQSARTVEQKNELLDMVWACKHQFACNRVIVVMPFMYGRRQEAAKNGEVNRSLQFVMNMKLAGVSHLILCDIHSRKTLEHCDQQGIAVVNADPSSVYAKRVRLHKETAEEEGREFFIYSPDAGSAKRAIPLARAVGCRVAMSFKNRDEEGEVSRISNQKELEKIQKEYPGVEIVVADKKLKDSIVCMREDELATGSTAKLAGMYLKEELGVHRVIFAVTHTVCVPGWQRKLLRNNPFVKILVGDTIERGYEDRTGGQLTEVTMSEVIANELWKVMRRILKEDEAKQLK